MFKLFEKIKNRMRSKEDLNRSVRCKEWEDKVEGLFPIEVDSFDSDIVILHMALSWATAPQQWCKENCRGQFVFGHFTFNGSAVFFEFEDEAMAFKLRWL